MAGLYGTLNNASKSMQTQQYVMSTINHNMANAGTQGYSRQVANVGTAHPFAHPSKTSSVYAQQVGTGTTITDIYRVRDPFLDYQIRNQSSVFGEYSSRDTYLYEVELVVNEPSDTGISSLMNNFYNAWQTLGNEPDSLAAKTMVVESAKALAGEMNNVYTRLEEIQAQSDVDVNVTLKQLNSTLEQINELNRQIITVSASGSNPNDLMDRRDILIDELSTIVNIDVTYTANNSVEIKCGDLVLVPAEPNQGVHHFTLDDMEHVTSGSLKGLLEVRETIEGYKEELDNTAKAMAYTINAVYYEATGDVFFINGDTHAVAGNGNMDNGINASNIMINPKFAEDPSLLRTGMDPDNTTDGSLALAMGQLKYVKFDDTKIGDVTNRQEFIDNCTGGFEVDDKGVPMLKDAKNGTTVQGYYVDLITQMGIDKQEAYRQLENQYNLLLGLEQSKMSVSGVSIDEEMTNLLMCQYTYTASSRVISTADELMQVVLSIV